LTLFAVMTLMGLNVKDKGASKSYTTKIFGKVLVKKHKCFKTIRTAKTALSNVNKPIVQLSLLRKGYGFALLGQSCARPRF